MSISRRQKRVGSLIKEELSRLLIETIQAQSSAFITVTRVEMTPDLKTAHIYLSLYGCEKADTTLQLIENKKGYLRKSVASRVKLKYNPMLIFHHDLSYEYEAKIDKLIKNLKKNEK